MSTALSAGEQKARLRLIRSENVGPMTFHALMQRFNSAEEALEALPSLAKAGGKRRAIALCPSAVAEKEMEQVSRLDGKLLFHGDDSYPAHLAAMDDAPPVLACLGHPHLLDRKPVALVGTRNASAAALAIASQLAHELAQSGCIVVSGLARGIDAHAHRAALKGGTVAVVAGGVDNIYPPEHKDLYRDIVSSGAVVSEMPLGVAPLRQHFPRRNRIIAGLSLAVVIVEAPMRSGAMITARMAGEKGRLVCAVPGSPADPRTEGNNYLLKQGATLITRADDILDEIAPMLREKPSAYQPLPCAEPVVEVDASARNALLTLLGPAPVNMDYLARTSELDSAVISTILLELELAGKIMRGNGQQVSLLADTSAPEKRQVELF